MAARSRPWLRSRPALSWRLGPQASINTRARQAARCRVELWQQAARSGATLLGWDRLYSMLRWLQAEKGGVLAAASTNSV